MSLEKQQRVKLSQSVRKRVTVDHIYWGGGHFSYIIKSLEVDKPRQVLFVVLLQSPGAPAPSLAKDFMFADPYRLYLSEIFVICTVMC